MRQQQTIDEAIVLSLSVQLYCNPEAWLVTFAVVFITLPDVELLPPTKAHMMLMQARSHAAGSSAKESLPMPLKLIADKADDDREYADLWHLLRHVLHSIQAERATVSQVIKSTFLAS